MSRASRAAMAFAFDIFAFVCTCLVSSWKKASTVRSYPGHLKLRSAHLIQPSGRSSHYNLVSDSSQEVGRTEFPLRMGAVSADSLSHRIPRWEEASRGLRRPTRTPHTACPCRKTKPGYMITYKRVGRTLIFLSRHFLHPVDGLPRYTMLD